MSFGVCHVWHMSETYYINYGTDFHVLVLPRVQSTAQDSYCTCWPNMVARVCMAMHSNCQLNQLANYQLQVRCNQKLLQ